jgi:hypothetical protein
MWLHKIKKGYIKMGRKKLLQKLCTGCNLILPRSEFYERSDGSIVWQCKKCSIKQSTKWIKAHQETIRENHRLCLIKNREKNPELYDNINKAWKEKNKERVSISSHASGKVRRAINKGILIKSTVCQKCKKTNCKIEAAHTDYSDPLNVLWLCVSCHRKLDYKNPKTIQSCGYI